MIFAILLLTASVLLIGEYHYNNLGITSVWDKKS